MPTVSVLMAFHRVTPFLRPAVRGILQQTIGDLELVLTDNGTGSGLAPLGAEGRDPRIRLLTQPTNLGIAGAHNAALAVARGEFIALSDYDDVSLPQRLERQVAALRADPALALVSCRAQAIDESGAVVGREFALTEAREQHVFSNYTVPAPSPSYTGRREIFTRFPFRDRFPVAADYDFIARAAEAGKIAGVPEVLFHYRRHRGQSTWEHQASQVLSACIIRLITARRRSGRPEELESLLTELRAWLATPPPVRELYLAFARRCLAEGFPRLAVYHARKVLATSRSVASWCAAVKVVSRALGAAPADAATLLRLWLTGPLRTHGLKPA